MNSKIKHTRWFCYNHTPTTSSLKLWKATTIPLLRNGTKSIGYLLPRERMKGIEPSSPTWKEGVMTIIRHSHFCVPWWIRTTDLFVNSELLSHWAKKTLCRVGRIRTYEFSSSQTKRGNLTPQLLYFISHMSKNTTNIQKKTFKNKKPRTFYVQGF